MGTVANNVRDRDMWGKAVRGEVVGNSKLSESDVLAIRRIHKTGNYYFREIADMFGIGKVQVSRIIRGIQWEHLLGKNHD